MSENSSIEWTDHTFNTHWGCHEVSPGCDNCYARELARRFGTVWGLDAERRVFGDKHWEEPLKWNAKAEKAGVRARVFSNSMSDLFDKNAPDGVRERWFELTKATQHLEWLALTKRISNVSRMLPADWGGGYANVSIGASMVNAEEWARDLQKLKAIPAHCRFVSAEPLLGDPGAVDLTGIHWVIVGGESGRKARPMHPAWAASLRDQCAAQGVPYLFKQWGEWRDVGSRAASPSALPGNLCRVSTPGFPDHFIAIRDDKALILRNVGKKAAGRLLDGVQHDGFPAAENAAAPRQTELST